MLSRHASSMLVLGLVAFTVGCAANKSIPVNSIPSGATVSVNGQPVGATPMILTTDDLMPNRAFDGKPSADAMVVIEKPGYSSYQLLVKEFALPNEIRAELQPDSGAQPPSSRASPDLLEELERLQQLREKGTITEEEFLRLKEQAIERSQPPGQP